MSSLKLVTTENFGNISCDFYRNMNDDILLTREQIGSALEYSNPLKAIQKIHLKHRDRLDPLSMKCKEIRYPQSGGAGIPVETTYYTERGIMEICRWSTKKKANQFMEKQIPKKKFSPWTKRMFSKYKLLMEHFDVTLKDLYHNLFLEFQNLYPDIDLVQQQEDYCFENGLENCYTMEVIEHNKDLRTLFEQMVDDLLDRYELKSDSNEEYTVRKTIFT